MAKEGIAAGGVMDINTASQEGLGTTLIHNGSARGICEAATALDTSQTHLPNFSLSSTYLGWLCDQHKAPPPT